MDGNFKLGSWLIEPGLNTVSRNGTSIRVAPKAMGVLLCLADHAGETVSKETLLRTVWPDTFVGDEVLKVSISDLRCALKDDARKPSLIQTVPKRGYRLVVSVEQPNANSGVASASGPVRDGGTIPLRARPLWTVLLVLVGFILLLVLLLVFNVLGIRDRLTRKMSPQIHSIAVLPLRNLSSDPNQEYFSDGTTDALITDLAQISSIKVISHTSTLQYKDTKKSLPEIARELNVDGIIEGTVQRSGDRVRITAQLIQCPSDSHLWANSYERDTGDILALEQEVTEDIAIQVQARIALPTGARQSRARSVNPKALDAYLEGNYHMHRVGHGSVDDELKTAADYFQQAMDADPNFAPAYLGLSDAIGSHLINTVDQSDASRILLEKALELDPNSSQAWTTLAGFKLYALYDWSGAEKDFRHAIALNPNNAAAHDELAQYLAAMGRIDEAWSECQITQELDPNQEHLSVGLFFRREYDRQLEVLLRWIARHPDDGDEYWNLYWAYTLKGLHKQAIEALTRSVSLLGLPETSNRVESAFAKSGYEAAMRTFAQELERLDGEKQAFFPGFTAEAYAVIGDKDRAFYWLEQAYQRRESVGREPGLVFIKVDPMLDSLRSDPRHSDLLRRIGLPP